MHRDSTIICFFDEAMARIRQEVSVMLFFFLCAQRFSLKAMPKPPRVPLALGDEEQHSSSSTLLVSIRRSLSSTPT